MSFPLASVILFSAAAAILLLECSVQGCSVWEQSGKACLPLLALSRCNAVVLGVPVRQRERERARRAG